MKKLFALLSLLLVVSVFAGCNYTDFTDKNPAVTSETFSTESKTESIETTDAPVSSAQSEPASIVHDPKVEAVSSTMSTVAPLDNEKVSSKVSVQNETSSANLKNSEPDVSASSVPKVASGNKNTSSVANITAARAKEIAFERAGVKSADARFVEVEYDFDDDWRRWEFSVEFESNGFEYSCEINAETGEIVEFEKERDD